MGVNAQTLKVENGCSFSSLNSSKFEMLHSNVYNYVFLLGVDYCENRWFSLSSEIGFVKKGGADKDLGLDDVKEEFNYFHVNTTFRVKYTIRDLCLYVGAGPKIDFLISDKRLKTSYYNVYNLKSLVPGTKLELGFDKSLSRKIKIGLNAAYLVNFGKIGDSTHNDLSDATFLLLFSFGYCL